MLFKFALLFLVEQMTPPHHRCPLSFRYAFLQSGRDDIHRILLFRLALPGDKSGHEWRRLRALYRYTFDNAALNNRPRLPIERTDLYARLRMNLLLQIKHMCACGFLRSGILNGISTQIGHINHMEARVGVDGGNPKALPSENFSELFVVFPYPFRIFIYLVYLPAVAQLVAQRVCVLLSTLGCHSCVKIMLLKMLFLS